MDFVMLRHDAGSGAFCMGIAGKRKSGITLRLGPHWQVTSFTAFHQIISEKNIFHFPKILNEIIVHNSLKK